MHRARTSFQLHIYFHRILIKKTSFPVPWNVFETIFLKKRTYQCWWEKLIHMKFHILFILPLYNYEARALFCKTKISIWNSRALWGEWGMWIAEYTQWLICTEIMTLWVDVYFNREHVIFVLILPSSPIIHMKQLLIDFLQPLSKFICPL